MFARVSIYEIPGESVNDAIDGFRDAMGTIAYLKGLTDAYFLVNREADRGVALTLWENHDAMVASRVTASRLRSDAIKPVGGTILSVEEFEVAVHEQGTAGLVSE